MIAALIILPIIAACLLPLFQSKRLNMMMTVGYAAIHLVLSICLARKPESLTSYFAVDDLNIIFLLVLSVVNLGVALFNAGFMRHSNAPIKGQTFYMSNILLFIATMTGVILTTHLAFLWVFVEATTLATAFLIYFNQTKSSLEAAWKYIFICSIGISLAFVGIIFLSMGLGGNDSLYFKDLYANAAQINPFLLKLAFPFMLAGFGTKVGFAPMHAWLPDAHAESPSPVSALLSGTLLNAALLGILRVTKIMDLAGLQWYSRSLLLLIGFISIFVAAVYLINIKNYKRMLAYSSIENMGIIAIGIGVGGVGIFAAILHIIAHSLTKAAFFLTSGTVLHRYHTKEISAVTGLLRTDPASGWLWMLCFAGIAGIPPFPIFLSEFLIAKSMIDNGMIVQLVLLLLLLTIIMAGIGRVVLRMNFGERQDTYAQTQQGLLAYLPQFAFISLLLSMGITLPHTLYVLIQKAAAML